MTNPRERTQKTSAQTEEPVLEEPTEQVEGQAQEVVEVPTVEPEEQSASPLDAVMTQAENAYKAYMEAERQVARAACGACWHPW